MDGTIMRTPSYVIPEMVKNYVAAVHPTTVYVTSCPSSCAHRSNSASDMFSFPLIGNQRMQGVKNITVSRPSNNASTHLFSRVAANNIPPSCLPGPEDDPIAYTRPYSLPCRFDLYGIPYKTVDGLVPSNSLWMSGYSNDFANKNLTKVCSNTTRVPNSFLTSES